MKKIEKFITLNCYGILVDRTNFSSEELIYKDGNYYLRIEDPVEVETDKSTCSVSYISTDPLYFSFLKDFVEKTGAEDIIISSIPEVMKVSVIYNIEEEE